MLANELPNGKIILSEIKKPNFSKYGFSSVITTAKEIATTMNVEAVFKERHVMWRNRQFDYEAMDEPWEIVEESWTKLYNRCNIVSSKWSSILEFWLPVQYCTIKCMPLDELHTLCLDLDLALRKGNSRDLNG